MWYTNRECGLPELDFVCRDAISYVGPKVRENSWSRRRVTWGGRTPGKLYSSVHQYVRYSNIHTAEMRLDEFEWKQLMNGALK